MAFTESLLRERGAYLLPIDGPPVEHLRRDSPFVRVVMIPRDIYPGQDHIVPTVGIDMLIVCRRDLDDDLAYRLTEQLFNVFPRLARVEATMRFLNIEDAPATPIPTPVPRTIRAMLCPTVALASTGNAGASMACVGAA